MLTEKQLDDLKTDIHNIRNKTFLRRLYRINSDTPKSHKTKLINGSTKKQRLLLIAVVHHVMAGDIHLREVHFPVIVKTKKLNFLKRNFVDKKGYKRLLSGTSKEQRDVLNQIPCYHQLLFNIFRR